MARMSLTAAVAAAVLNAAAVASAQPRHEIVHSFIHAPGNPAGTLLEASDGRIYGVASEGGVHRGGAVLRFSRSGTASWVTEVVHAFRASDGIRPLAGLAQGPDGALYGTTSAGGALGGGTIFKVTLAGAFQVLHAFNPATEGFAPLYAPLALAPDGLFYGTAARGGPAGFGTVFRIAPTGAFAVLRTFSGLDGKYPTSGLTLAPNGQLFGTALYGGDSDRGTIFRVTVQGTSGRVHSFAGLAVQPQGPLAVGPDGALYGTTTGVTGFNCGFGCTRYIGGTLFRFTTAGTLTIMKDFGGGDQFGAGLTRAPNGLLYGVSQLLQILEVNPLTGAVEFIAHNDSAGTTPLGSLLAASDGRLYGTASSGARGRAGSLFAFTPGPAPDVELVRTFESPGFNPSGRLLLASDGNLYGTALQGGGDSGCPDSGGCGTVFRLDPGGTITTVIDEPVTTHGGSHPIGDLMEASDGRFNYGLAFGGIAAIDKDGGNARLIHSGNPWFTAPPVETANGVLYFHHSGGPISLPAIYRQEPNAAATIVQLLNVYDPPWGALIQGHDGALYGTTYGSGSFPGTIFRVTLDGAFTTLHEFTGSDGAHPFGTLVQTSDGLLYGTTFSGGPIGEGDGNGTIFRIAPDGTQFDTIHAFGAAEGTHPFAGLTLGPDGTLYGTATSGGAGAGTVFSLSPSGDFAVLHAFQPGEGAVPLGGVTLLPGGSLYGTTFSGGAGNAGTVYRLRFDAGARADPRQ